MAEYFSAELSQKIHRGMEINAQKCLSNGSNPGLGFKVDKDRRFYVDEEEARIVREIFERYASGETKAEIVKDLKRRKIKTSLGNDFTYNSLSRMLSNKRYIGVYMYKGQETPGGMPRILDDDLFYKVQDILDKNKKAPARTHGEGEYLLTTNFVCEMPLDDVNKRRAIINILVHSVYLYDDHFTLIINASKKPMRVDDIPLEEIEEAFNSDKTCTEQCSTMTSPAPPFHLAPKMALVSHFRSFSFCLNCSFSVQVIILVITGHFRLSAPP